MLGRCGLPLTFLMPDPHPPVWHTSIFDCEGFKEGYIPFPYLVHTVCIPAIPKGQRIANSKALRLC